MNIDSFVRQVSIKHTTPVKGAEGKSEKSLSNDVMSCTRFLPERGGGEIIH